VLGELKLGPESFVQGELVNVGGPFQQAEGAVVNGPKKIVSQGLPRIDWLFAYVRRGIMLGRPFPAELAWVRNAALAITALYWLVALLFPRPVRSTVTTLKEQPLTTLLVGLFVFAALGPAIFLLGATVVGLVAVPFFVCAVIGGLLLGKVAVAAFVGDRLTSVFRRELPVNVTFLIGMAIILALYAIPVVGFLLWGLFTVLALGGVSLACAKAVKRPSSGAVVGGGAPPVAAAVPEPVTTLHAHTAAAGVASAEATSFSAGGTAQGGAAFQQSEPSYASAANPGPLGTDAVLLPRVGFGLRLAAAVLDLVLVWGIHYFLKFPFPLTAAIYFLVMWGWRGTTIGSFVLGLRIVRTNGEKLTFGVAAVRVLGCFFSAIVLFLGFLWIAWDPEKQGWHDKIAGTLVVRVPGNQSLF
jgi:uncharacterized RDD family membrane protein YckC